jgi:hypothetical protein
VRLIFLGALIFDVATVIALGTSSPSVAPAAVRAIGEQVLERLKNSTFASCQLWGDLPGWLALFEKYFSSRFARNTFTDSRRPASNRGAYRDRHERWVRDAVDAVAAQDERGQSGRRSRVVLAPRRWR